MKRLDYETQERTRALHVALSARRAMIDKAAHEAATASWDAHGEFVPAQMAYDFIFNCWLDSRGIELPTWMPAEFAHDYRRYCRVIADGNSFIVSELSRPVTAQPEKN